MSYSKWAPKVCQVSRYILLAIMIIGISAAERVPVFAHDKFNDLKSFMIF